MTSAVGVNCSEKSVSLQSTVLGTLLFIALWSNRVPVEPDKRDRMVLVKRQVTIRWMKEEKKS